MEKKISNYEKAIKLHSENKSIEEIADILNLKKNTVREYINKSKRYLNKEHRNEIAQNLYLIEKKSIEEIAQIMGVKVSAIRTYLGNFISTKKENKPYEVIKRQSEWRYENVGYRWGSGYVKEKPRVTEKIDLSEYDGYKEV